MKKRYIIQELKGVSNKLDRIITSQNQSPRIIKEAILAKSRITSLINRVEREMPDNTLVGRENK